jgi:hypothetical protein
MNNRLNNSFKPVLPSNTVVIIIPAMDNESTDINTNSAGRFLHKAMDTTPAPSIHARAKNEKIGYLRTKPGLVVLNVFKLINSHHPTVWFLCITSLLNTVIYNGELMIGLGFFK